MTEDYQKLCDTICSEYDITSTSKLQNMNYDCNKLIKHNNRLSEEVRVLTELLSREHNNYIEACEYATNCSDERDELYNRLMQVKHLLLHTDSTVRMSKELRLLLEKIFNI